MSAADESGKQRPPAATGLRIASPAFATSLEAAVEQFINFTPFSPEQWKSARSTDASERLHEAFKRRIKTLTVLPLAETEEMLFWALFASGQIVLSKIDGWQTIA